jgi:hypothetical protein
MIILLGVPVCRYGPRNILIEGAGDLSFITIEIAGVVCDVATQANAINKEAHKFRFIMAKL